MEGVRRLGVHKAAGGGDLVELDLGIPDLRVLHLLKNKTENLLVDLEHLYNGKSESLKRRVKKMKGTHENVVRREVFLNEGLIEIVLLLIYHGDVISEILIEKNKLRALKGRERGGGT